MSSILIENAIVFTGREVFKGGIYIEEGVVKMMGSDIDRTSITNAAEVINGNGRLVTGGLTIAHTHAYSSLARGIILKSEPAKNFVEVLEKLWWLLDRKLTLPEVELSGLLHGVECLKSGITTIFDHHASYGAIRGCLDKLGKSFEKIGIRASLCFEVSDRWGKACAEEAIQENVDFIEKNKGKNSLIRGMFGLHASFTIGEETLKRCVQAVNSDTIGFHIHVAEDRFDQEETIRKYGKRVIRRLSDAGVLGKKTICSHGIYLEDSELELLASSHSYLVYNPQSNLNNGVGALNLKRAFFGDVKVVLGTDGFTSNIFREALIGQILQNYLHSSPSEGWNYFPKLLLINNNDLLFEHFGVDNREIKIGKACDIVLWNYNPPTPITEENFWGHAIFGLLDSKADFVIVGGNLVLRDGKSAGIDEESLYKECRISATNLWNKIHTL